MICIHKISFTVAHYYLYIINLDIIKYYVNKDDLYQSQTLRRMWENLDTNINSILIWNTCNECWCVSMIVCPCACAHSVCVCDSVCVCVCMYVSTHLIAEGLWRELLVQGSHLGCQFLEIIPEFVFLSITTQPSQNKTTQQHYNMTTRWSRQR